MDNTLRSRLSQFWSELQHDLFPFLREEEHLDLTPTLEQVIRVLEFIEIERFVPSCRGWVGRPPKDRVALARAFVAKAVLNLPTTEALIDRLQVDRTLRRICGFEPFKPIPDASRFSRAFAELTAQNLPARVHEALIRRQLGDQLIFHVARDATEIEAREKPTPKPVVEAVPTQPKKRGRPRKGEERPKELTVIEQQLNQDVTESLAALPKACDVGTKKNSKGFKESWIGYKLHIESVDGNIPVSAILTAASVHDSQAAIPLTRLTADRITSLYDLADSAYCSGILRQVSRDAGHAPIIDHNPRGGPKIEFAPHEAERYRARSQAERINGYLKDHHGGRSIWVKGHDKVYTHLMFGILVIAAEQILRLLH
jgi:hypothetical protein